MRRPRLPRLSLLGAFSLLSLVLIAAIGVVLGLVLHSRIERRALLDAERLAEVVTRVGVYPHLIPGELRGGPLTADRITELSSLLRGSVIEDARLAHVKLYGLDGHVAWSDDPSVIGSDAWTSPMFRRARAGTVVSKVDAGGAEQLFDSGEPARGRGRRLLEIYVPLRSRDGRAVEGVFEAYLPYEPVATAIAEDTLRLVLVLVLGFAVLYASLFRIVARASQRLRRQALHDALTGLPNRTLLYERCEKAMAAAKRNGRTAALLLIDLDRFKEVNDTLGHDHGDELLVEVSRRLERIVRRGDVLARLGGDEFAVLLADVPHRGIVGEIATRLHGALGQPFELRGVAVDLEASVGVALSPLHGDDVTTLLRRADVAMYEAKQSGARIETYDVRRDPYSPERLSLLAELRRALDEDELVLHYQPKISLATGQVIGVEALVRWEHPTRGLLAPGEFIPLAERTGMVADLTRWVLDAAVRQCGAWREEGLDLPVAVNLAAGNIVDAALPDAAAATLDRYGVPGDRLECEISEHTVMSDPRRAGEVLARLRDMGVRLSLDDFGKGQSSLSYLKRLPLDEVKIDRSFVAGMADDDDDAAIVRSTIDLARHLGLEVVAEGVETAEVVDGLRDLHCDIAQGFHFSRPLPGDALRAWLAEHRRAMLTG
jgi:diguanylate cyclase (GGDEF)-like protein